MRLKIKSIDRGVKTTLESQPVERLTMAPIRNLSTVAGNGLRLTRPEKDKYGSLISKSTIAIKLEWRRRR